MTVDHVGLLSTVNGMVDLISREEVLKLPQRKGYAVNGWETNIRVSDIKEWPALQTREVECEKCYWSDEKGCSIFCRAWNRYTSHGGFCHQFADMRGEQSGKK